MPTAEIRHLAAGSVTNGIRNTAYLS